MAVAPVLRVLVVEDHPEVRRLVVRCLRSKGCVVTAAADGADALKLLKDLEVDVVLSDIDMPGMDGVGLHAQAIAARPLLRNRFVFMSSHQPPPVVAHVPHLIKPFELSRLWTLVLDAANGGGWRGGGGGSRLP